jgi:L-amino acid N-acyltransferase
MHIRLAKRTDVPGIQALYNHAVLTSTASYDDRPQPNALRYAWFDDHAKTGLPAYVALDGVRMIGWASLGRFRPRPGYRFTVEDSVYVVDDWHGKGVGSTLLGQLLDDAHKLHLHSVIAVIGDDANVGSIALHAKLGFVHVARLPEVGFKFGRWLTQVWMQRLIDAPPSA